MSGPYDDIMDLPHPTSKKHPRMSMGERAAQFSPFAALTGFGEVIRETGRLTDQRVELGESDREELDRQLHYLCACERERPGVQVTYFVPDELKEGGSYTTITGKLKRVDPGERILMLEEGHKIPIGEIVFLKVEEMRGRNMPSP